MARKEHRKMPMIAILRVAVLLVCVAEAQPDNCPDDPAKTEPGLCGCGTADDDSDGDGIPDCRDNLTCGDVLRGTNVGFPRRGDQLSGHVVFEFHLPFNRNKYTLSTCDPGTDFDTVLLTFNDSGLSNSTARNDDYGFLCPSNKHTSLIPGENADTESAEIIYIVVEGYRHREGNFTLSIECEPLPEDCEAHADKLNNGVCDHDLSLNNPTCGYDGGDCCGESCLASHGDDCNKSSSYVNHYQCRDPTYCTCPEAPYCEQYIDSAYNRTRSSCLCPKGFSHSRYSTWDCSTTEAWLCENTPCENGGVCSTEVVGYQYCHCPKEFFGSRCQTPVETCDVADPKRIGDGRCDDGEGDYNTAGCAFDGGDCCMHTCVSRDFECGEERPFSCRIPGCGVAQNPELQPRLSDKICDAGEGFNTPECGYDGGDCCEETCINCARAARQCRDRHICPCVHGYCYQEPPCANCLLQITYDACVCENGYVGYLCDYVKGSCGAPSGLIGNGVCDDEFNTEDCYFDGGDCCPETCTVHKTTSEDDSCEYYHRWQDSYAYKCREDPYNTCSNGVLVKERYRLLYCACDEGYGGYNCEISKDQCDADNMGYIGDGYCDNAEPYNTEACGFDGGDCCESTCYSTFSVTGDTNQRFPYRCGANGYSCLDPNAPSPSPISADLTSFCKQLRQTLNAAACIDLDVYDEFGKYGFLLFARKSESLMYQSYSFHDMNANAVCMHAWYGNPARNSEMNFDSYSRMDKSGPLMVSWWSRDYWNLNLVRQRTIRLRASTNALICFSSEAAPHTPHPTAAPTPSPTLEPTPMPTSSPTHVPTSAPTPIQTSMPTEEPTGMPTGEPTPIVTSMPTPWPTLDPTQIPTGDPTGVPTPTPTEQPTLSPSAGPTPIATNAPTPSPTLAPTSIPFGIFGIVSARLSSSGALIEVSFSLALNVEFREKRCNGVVAPSTVSQLGSSPQCWLSASRRELFIRIGSSAAISVGTAVSFEGISAIENPNQVSLSSALQPPLDPANVVAVIQGPRFGSCGDALVVDGRSSTGSAGRPLRYTWRIDSDPANVEPNLSELEDLVRLSTKDFISIPKAMLPFGSTLHFELTVSNWLQTNGTSRHSVVLSEARLPVLSGVDRVETTTETAMNYLSVHVELPCDDQAVTSYTWSSVWGTLENGCQPTRNMSLDDNEKNSGSELRIPRSKLQEPSQEYAFNVEVETSDGAIADHTFCLTVKPPEVIAKTGTSQTICVDDDCDDLVVDAEDRFRFSHEIAKAGAEYMWECEHEHALLANEAGPAPCFDEITSESVFGSRDDDTKRSVRTLTLARSLLRDLAPGTLTLTVHMYPDNNIGLEGSFSAKMNVTISPPNIDAPVVSIIPLEVSKITIGDTVRIQSNVDYDGDQDDLRYRWSCETNNFDLENAALLSSGRKSPNLVILPNSLEPGIDYVFSVSVSVVSGTPSAEGQVEVASSASITLVTNFPPTGGSFKVVDEGSALRKRYKVACKDWSDDPEDEPLFYRIKQTHGEDDTQAILTQWSDNPSALLYLSSGTNVLTAEVRDRLGATTSVELRIIVPDLREALDQNKTVTDIVADQLIANNTLKNATVDEQLQMITAVSGIFEEVPPSGVSDEVARDEVRIQLFETLEAVAEEVGEPTSDEVEQRLRVAVSLTGSSSPSSSTELDHEITNFVSSELSRALSSENADEGITSGMANAALDVLGRSQDADMEVFNQVVYQVSRGITERSFSGEDAVQVDTRYMSMRCQKTKAANVSRNIDIAGSTVLIPEKALVFKDANDATTVVSSYVSYSGSFITTVGPNRRSESPLQSDATRRTAAGRARRKANSLLSADEGSSAGAGPFADYIYEATNLESISDTVQVVYYVDNEVIDKNNRQVLEVIALDPCDAIQVKIKHNINPTLLRLVADGGTPPVVRHFHEGATTYSTDCVTTYFTQDYTIANCTQLAFFNVGGWGTYEPSPTSVSVEHSSELSARNIGERPSGIIALVVVTLIFVGAAAYVHRFYQRDVSSKEANAEDDDLNLDEYRQLIVENGELTLFQKCVFVSFVDIRDSHTWTSIFYRPAKSTLTPQDRLLLAFVFTMSTMALAAVQLTKGFGWFATGVSVGLASYCLRMVYTWLMLAARSRSDNGGMAIPQADLALDNGGDVRRSSKTDAVLSDAVVKGVDDRPNAVISKPNPRKFNIVRMAVYGLILAWTIGCWVIVLAYVLQLYTMPPQLHTYYRTCVDLQAESEDVEPEADLTGAWASSIALSIVWDFAFFQPLVTFMFAIVFVMFDHQEKPMSEQEILPVSRNNAVDDSSSSGVASDNERAPQSQP